MREPNQTRTSKIRIGCSTSINVLKYLKKLRDDVSSYSNGENHLTYQKWGLPEEENHASR